MKEEIKRLFFGIEVHAPWPYLLPKGRILDHSQATGASREDSSAR